MFEEKQRRIVNVAEAKVLIFCAILIICIFYDLL